MEENTEHTTKQGEQFTGAEAMYITEFEGISQYKRPYSFELAGQTMALIFDDGLEIIVTFSGGHTLSWTENASFTEYYNYDCLKATDLHYLVHFEKKGRWPREGVTLIIDLNQDLVTGNFLTQGADEDFINLVQRKIRFGAISCSGKALPMKRHEYTKDLIGKKITYTYNPLFSVTHIYYSDKLSRAVLTKKTSELAAINAETPREYKLFEEESIYLKIDEGVYVFSWIEKNFGSGTQGFMLMDTRRVHDVGVFFGVNPKGEPESYMVTAYGVFEEERLPEESAISPWRYDWE